MSPFDRPSAPPAHPSVTSPRRNRPASLPPVCRCKNRIFFAGRAPPPTRRRLGPGPGRRLGPGPGGARVRNPSCWETLLPSTRTVHKCVCVFLEFRRSMRLQLLPVLCPRMVGLRPRLPPRCPAPWRPKKHIHGAVVGPMVQFEPLVSPPRPRVHASVPLAARPRPQRRSLAPFFATAKIALRCPRYHTQKPLPPCHHHHPHPKYPCRRARTRPRPQRSARHCSS